MKKTAPRHKRIEMLKMSGKEKNLKGRGRKGTYAEKNGNNITITHLDSSNEDLKTGSKKALKKNLSTEISPQKQILCKCKDKKKKKKQQKT